MNATWWTTVIGVSTFAMSACASGHAIAYKRASRSATAWILAIWLLPWLGALGYFLLGVNRIERRAQRDRADGEEPEDTVRHQCCTEGVFCEKLDRPGDHFLALMHFVDRATSIPLLQGNKVELLQNGDEAYPAMLAAIDAAEKTIALSTYIFDNDAAGALFAEALARAVVRGIEVRVLIDGVGARYSWPSIVRRLRQTNVLVQPFNPTRSPWAFRYANLRSHRKILVVDGMLGFTGGMNIRQGSLLEQDPKSPIVDLHARIEGPVVAHLQQAFIADWGFTSGEWLSGKDWLPRLEAQGKMLARGLADGPDDVSDPIRLTVLGALATAKKSVRIVTPYFLPDTTLISALNVAAMRGIEVDIVIPETSNLLLVQWACQALLWQVLTRGCRVWKSPPPFDHTKLIVVDDLWIFMGSANWDTRSFRLNFEFNLECYDCGLAEQSARLIDDKIARAHEVTLAEVDQRSLLVRLRDGTARLAAPFL